MKIILIALLAAMAAACSNEKSGILQMAERPGIRFNKDTVVVREKDWTNVNVTGNGKLTVYCSDPGHSLNLQLEDTGSRVHLLYRGVEIAHGASLPLMDSVQLFCVADTPGLYAIECRLTDRLGRVGNTILYVRCVPSAAPVANFLVRDMGSAQLQSWDYLFDASTTAKPDGIITEYHFSVNGQALVSNQPQVNWTFHSKGDHRVSLYVVDELGQRSAEVFQTVSIQ